jgi:hypothetical protein
MQFNLNISKVKPKPKPSQKPNPEGSSKLKQPLSIFAQAMEEDEDAAPISQRDLVNLQIMESAKKNSLQAIKLQAEALAQGESFDIDSYIKDDNEIEPEIELPQKQTMNGQSRYLCQLLKAKERRDRDKW